MIIGKVQRLGDEFVVTIPEEEINHLLWDGDKVIIELTPLGPDMRPQLRPEVARIIAESSDATGPDMRYLKDT